MEDKKKRGRKPKTKVDDQITPPTKVVEKKKRGRKKKCYLNEGEKISGYIDDLPTIDINPNNEIIGTSGACANTNTGSELQFGGNLIIRKINSGSQPDTHNLHHNFLKQHRQQQSEEECKIDLSKIYEPESPKTLTQQQQESNNGILNILNKVPSRDKNDKSSSEKTEGNKTNNENSRKKNKQKRNKPDSVIIMQKRGDNVKEWPESTDVLCWWCAHPFEGMPCFVPTKFDEKRGRFKVTGNFCSWNCAKSYTLFDNAGNIRGRNMNMFLMLMLKLKLPYNVKCAPRRECLKAFGGFLTIKEYRENYLYQDKFKLVTTPYDLEIDKSYRILRYQN